MLMEGTVVQSHLPPFQNLGNLIHFTCMCLSEQTLKANGLFCLVSISGELKIPCNGANVWPVVNSLILEEKNSENKFDSPLVRNIWLT